MGKSKDLATGETRFVNTAGDTMTGNLAINNASGSQVTLHRTDTTIANDDLYGQIILSGDDADTNSSGTRGYIRARSQGSGGGLKMEFGTAGGGVVIGDPRMTINADGIVTKPNHPSFLAYRAGSNYTTTTANWEKVLLDGTRWNTGSHFNTTNNRFIAPVDGVYHFDGGVNRYSLPVGTIFRVGLRVNGSEYVYGQVDYSPSTGDLKYGVSSTIKLDANDYVELWSYVNTTSSNGFSSGTNWNTLSGHLVG